MNRKQYFVVSWFFFVLMFILMKLHITFWLSQSLSFLGSDLSVGMAYTTTKWAIFSVMIYLCFPLFVLFQILAWLEPKKLEDDVPKEHREVMKLARLEHEVKELKSKLKQQGKIKS